MFLWCWERRQANVLVDGPGAPLDSTLSRWWWRWQQWDSNTGRKCLPKGPRYGPGLCSLPACPGHQREAHSLKLLHSQIQRERGFTPHIKIGQTSQNSPSLLILCPLYPQKVSAASEEFSIRFLLTLKVPVLIAQISCK